MHDHALAVMGALPIMACAVLCNMRHARSLWQLDEPAAAAAMERISVRIDCVRPHALSPGTRAARTHGSSHSTACTDYARTMPHSQVHKGFFIRENKFVAVKKINVFERVRVLPHRQAGACMHGLRPACTPLPCARTHACSLPRA